MNRSDLVCFSHLRWGFTFQRPNHLMTRFASERRVFFIEEPLFDSQTPRWEVRTEAKGVLVCTPHLPGGNSAEQVEARLNQLVLELLAERNVRSPVLWFYTPMALPLAKGIDAALVIYDCMDELTGFLGAPPELGRREKELFDLADLVFTGGQSLYEAKCDKHPAIFAFPSSVDVGHFSAARVQASEPADQAPIPRPRIGFFGVLDERLDLELLSRLADARPEYQFVMLGPVVKISETALPRRENLHYLGSRSYAELPLYLAGWDVAMMPFALNDATRFISPTKTLEYLAAGKPVVSTAIRDVVNPYGQSGLVRIADANGFPEAVDEALRAPRAEHLARCEELLANTSWDRTWARMAVLIHDIENEPEPITLEAKTRSGVQACSTT